MGPFHLYRQRLQQRLDRATAHCRLRGSDLILSAEGLWRSSPEDFGRFRRLRAYLVGQGFEVVVIGYLRPLLPWLSSLYQQSLKFANAEFRLDIQDFKAIIEELWLVFGRANVTIYPYDAASFPGGCVVQHFCRQIGFCCPPGYRTSVNESLSRSACGLLLAYNRQRPLLPSTGMHQAVEYAPILRHLQRLPGSSLRLHPTVLERWAPTLVRQEDWLERELGLRLSPSATEATAVSSIPPRWETPTSCWPCPGRPCSGLASAAVCRSSPMPPPPHRNGWWRPPCGGSPASGPIAYASPVGPASGCGRV